MQPFDQEEIWTMPAENKVGDVIAAIIISLLVVALIVITS